MHQVGVELDIPINQLAHKVATAKSMGLYPKSVTLYGSAFENRVSVIWVTNTANRHWDIVVFLATEFQTIVEGIYESGHAVVQVGMTGVQWSGSAMLLVFEKWPEQTPPTRVFLSSYSAFFSPLITSGPPPADFGVRRRT